MLALYHQPGAFSHAGIVEAAAWLRDELVRRRVLADFLEAQPDYQLVICGHSLGAGTSALLSLMLHQRTTHNHNLLS
jgi:pimeloyl-ACP methyl ester carboxylesterase